MKLKKKYKQLEQIEINKLIEKYVPFAEGLTNKLMRSLRLPPELKDEFYSAARFGLVEAANRFDPSLEVAFESYAFIRVRGAVIDYIRSTSALSSGAYRLQQKLANELLENTNTDGLDTDKAITAWNVPKGNTGLAFRAGNSELTSQLYEMSNRTLSIESRLINAELSNAIWKEVQNLPELQKLIFETYYLKDINFAEIAFKLRRCSKSWITRQHQRAIKQIRTRLHEKGLLS